MQLVRSIIAVEDEITIESLTVQVEIRHTHIGDLRVLLVSPEGAVVALHGQADGTAENLFETYTSLDHAGLATLVGAPAQGEWTLTVGDYSDEDIGTLEAWSLEISGFVRVLAGGSAAVTASLAAVETPLGTPRLFADETLAVTLAYHDGTGVALSGTLMTFDAESTAVGVTLDAALDATPGTLTAVVSGAVPVNVEVAPAALSVEIAPRRFRLSLSDRFSRTERPNEAIPDDTDTQSVHSIITVEDEITIESLTVQVEIRHSHIGDLRVLLVSPEGAVVALHDRAGGATNNLFETYTSLGHTGLAALAGAPAQGEWTLTVGDFADGDIGTLEAWSLEISGFARVLAGGSAAVTVSLVAVETPLGTPRLFAGETPEVALAYDGTGVALSEQMVMFDAGSTAVGVTLDALFDAMPGTLTAVVAGAVPVNVEIASAALSVEIAPRRFRLSLSGAPFGDVPFVGASSPVALIPDGQSSLRSVITVPEITIESLVVQVAILHPDTSDLRVVLVPPGVAEEDGVLLHDQAIAFEKAYTSVRSGLADLIGRGFPAGDWVLRVEDFQGGNVGVLNAWYLEINTGAQMLAGESIPVVVTLSGVDTPFGASRLFAGETLTVDWTYTDGAGVTLSPAEFDVTSPTPTSSVEAASTLSATPDATAGVLEATFDAAAGLVNAEIDPAVVPVQPIRRFRLAFVPATTARVLAGGTTEVAVALENPEVLRAGEQLLVSLQPTTVTVIPLELTLTSTMLHVPFTIEARHDAVPPLGMVVASGEVLSGDAPVANTGVVSTTLTVEIAPRRFRLVVLSEAGPRLRW